MMAEVVFATIFAGLCSLWAGLAVSWAVRGEHEHAGWSAGLAVMLAFLTIALTVHI
jgi:hypothetical protein